MLIVFWTARVPRDHDARETRAARKNMKFFTPLPI
jgi:hypothetical protein